ncbi:hypothetical protein WG68_04530 [Arsukibacterium ikkense]|uniref:Uncharacterized protein n=1 Tax=Arsukibacterium ikkense TaxID=336831 RepID=A0A0M2VBR9_9GAMM|nr:hypothetical protein [Arsukibacterium ikkense]KKO46573.1 hypothetical protein WG68_04530 [Arsukibacterium ikkense]
MKFNNSDVFTALIFLLADASNEAAEPKRLRDMSMPAALYSLFETACIGFGWLLFSIFMGLGFESDLAVLIVWCFGAAHVITRLFFIKQFNQFIVDCENEVTD